MKKLLLIIPLLASLVGCKTPDLEFGGAYNPSITNEVGEVLAVAAPESALFIADSSYKFAYETIFAVMKFERDNRAEIQKLSPQVKVELDKLRPKIVEIDRRWALARLAYKVNPTPNELSTLKRIVAEISRLVPVVQSQLNPAFEAITEE